MMKMSLVKHDIGMLFLVVFVVIGLTFPSGVSANAKVVEINGVSYNVNVSIADNLKSLMGKKVYVTLNSGKVLSGNVKSVGKRLVHIEKLDGREFFDALVKIEDISAIDTRFRDYERK